MLYLPLVSPPWMGWTETRSRWQNNKLFSGGQVGKNWESPRTELSVKVIISSSGGLICMVILVDFVDNVSISTHLMSRDAKSLKWSLLRFILTILIIHQSSGVTCWPDLAYMAWIVFQSKHKLVWLGLISIVLLIHVFILYSKPSSSSGVTYWARPGTRADPPST